MLYSNRRSVLQVSAAGAAVATVAPALSGVVTTAAGAAAPKPKFPGHVPGKIYLGLTGGGFGIAPELSAPVGLRRTYYEWNDVSREIRNITTDHRNKRLPWISFKPPGGGSKGWKPVGDGDFDADIRARARAYAKLNAPVIVTFNHEPHNDGGDPRQFRRAFKRIHDVMEDETGLKHVLHVPIIGEWVFNPYNKQHSPKNFADPGVLRRCAFFGADLYQNDTGERYNVRLRRITRWLDRQGFPNKMVGLGESAATDDFGAPNGATWWRESWAWATESKRVAAIGYFNSDRNNTLGENWLLRQSRSKFDAYDASVRSAHTTRLTV